MNAHFYVYERALRESSSIRGIPKNKLKQIVSEHKYYKYKLFFGRFLYDKRDYNHAKRIIQKCIAIKPFVLINWILFLRCYLPERMINVIKCIKNKILKI